MTDYDQKARKIFIKEMAQCDEEILKVFTCSKSYIDKDRKTAFGGRSENIAPLTISANVSESLIEQRKWPFFKETKIKRIMINQTVKNDKITENMKNSIQSLNQNSLSNVFENRKFPVNKTCFLLNRSYGNVNSLEHFHLQLNRFDEIFCDFCVTFRDIS